MLKNGQSDQPGRPNIYQVHLETVGIIDKLETLLLHPNRSVYEVTVALIENYFDVLDPI